METDYVQESRHEMRQDSWMVDDSMLRRLNKQDSEKIESGPALIEELKEEVKELVKRPSIDKVEAKRGSRHQSFLSTQFVPMRPIVHTREIETQTESAPLSTFATTETQTETAETNSIRV